MATRSKIGLMLPDGMVKSVYHHWDGYPEWLGHILTKRYTDKTTIDSLLDGGDISCIESDHDWDRNELCNPMTLYYKDRGEDCPFLIEDYNTFLKCYRGEEYVYLFKNNQWYCYDSEGNSVQLMATSNYAN